jgi:p-aminobenzoyl-glutamate transporter AbgT
MEWLTKLSFAVLTCNAALALYRSADDSWSLVFVMVSYFALVLLFWCLHLFERAAADAARKLQLKIAVWSLSTLVTMMFAYRVAALMPWLLAIVVWIMAVTVPVGGFYAFFIYCEQQ